MNVKVLIVAWWGGGWGQTWGWGWGWGVIENNIVPIWAWSYNIVVGTLWAKAPAWVSPCGARASSWWNSSAFWLTAIGWGWGWSYNGSINNPAVQDGGLWGSGGGWWDNWSYQWQWGAATAWQGNVWWRSTVGDPYYGWGWGWAWGAWWDAWSRGGTGWNWYSSSISGTATYYGAGWGGCWQGAGTYWLAGLWGVTWWDNGQVWWTPTPNKWWGGAWWRDYWSVTQWHTDGASWVVIIAYKTDGSDGIKNTSTGGTITTSGLYTIHTFTTSGTFVAVEAPISLTWASFLFRIV